MENKKLVEINNNEFITDVCQIVERGRSVAYQSISHAMTMTYWQLGRRIVEEEQKGEKRAEYGSQLIKTVAEELTKMFGKGFSERSVRNFRQFYSLFPEFEIWHTRVPNLTWAHFRCLFRVLDKKAREWYLLEASNEIWSVRTLDRNISTQYYERLLLSQASDKVKKEMQVKTADFQHNKLEFIKNPLVAEFLGLSPNIEFTETELEQRIITHIQKFIMELGKGYAFVARQQHIKTDMADYFIDLVFYNYILKCFVLVDLKNSRITHQDVGQMDMYVRMYDDLKRQKGDNPTLGIILCSETDADIAKYSVLHGNEQLFATQYKLLLPDEDALRQEIEMQKEIFRMQHKQSSAPGGD